MRRVPVVTAPETLFRSGRANNAVTLRTAIDWQIGIRCQDTPHDPKLEAEETSAKRGVDRGIVQLTMVR
jgi:hypothetical protein